MSSLHLDSTPAKYPPSFWLTLVVAIISLTLSAFNSYTRNAQDLSNRVAIIENQQRNDGAAIQRVESKVDKVDGKVDKLSDYLMGPGRR